MKFLLLFLLLFFSKLLALDISYAQGGKVTEEAVLKVKKALDSTGISYNVRKNSFLEQLKEIKVNKKELCMITWQKVNNYKSFIKYSNPFYSNRLYAVITQKRSKLENKIDINELLQVGTYKILVKKDNNYTKELDNILNTLKKKIINTKKDENLVTLIAKKKGDITILSHDKALELTKTHKYKSRIKLVELEGLNIDKRYLACSFRVSDRLISAINKNLKE